MPDARWSKVYATSGPDPDVPNTTRLLIEVKGPSGTIVGRQVRVDNRELGRFPQQYGLVLDHMVRKLDEALHA